MTTIINVTDWHPERVAGYVDAVRGNSTGAQFELVLRCDDADREGNLLMSLTDEDPTDTLVAHECTECNTITLSRVLSLDSLHHPERIDATDAPGRNGNAAD